MPLPGNISADLMIAQVFCGVNVQTRQKSSDFIHILHKPQSLIIVVQEHGLDDHHLVVFLLLHRPIWPKSIAPWQVHLCAVRADNEEVRKFADDLYEKLQETGIEVIYDDRTVSAGVMFSDADLLGVPLRVIVSPRNMKQGVIEVVSRDKTLQTQVKMEEAAEQVKKYL